MRVCARACARAAAHTLCSTSSMCSLSPCRGGPRAPRTPADGARTIYAALVADPALTGTGNLINRDGKVVEWL